MAEDLNWQYRMDPLNDYETVTARRHGELVGFAVFTTSENGVRVVDLVGSSERARLSLLRRIVEIAYTSRREFVDVWLVPPSPESTLAQKSGFVRREPAKRVVVYPPYDAGVDRDTGPTEWHF